MESEDNAYLHENPPMLTGEESEITRSWWAARRRAAGAAEKAE
jgi:hypothetical protein